MQTQSIEDLEAEMAAAPAYGGSNRADYYKLKEGSNRVLIVSMPKIFSELFGVGIAYDQCGYGDIASVRFMCYVKDMTDQKIKLAKFSYRITQQILDLAKGARTKFMGFPMPYVVNIETKNAGKTNVSNNIIADNDEVLTPEDLETLAALDTTDAIIERMKASQRKKMQDDPAYYEEVQSKIAIEREKRGIAPLPVVHLDAQGEDKPRPVATQPASAIPGVVYPEDDLNPEDIPF